MDKPISSKALLVYAFLIPPLMALLFSYFGNAYGKTVGYFLPYAVYLIIALCGFVVFSKRKIEKKFCAGWIKYLCCVLAFIPAAATFFIAFLPTLNYFKRDFLFILLIYSLLNGVIEELFWRFTFNSVFKDDIVKAYIIPTVIFSCWHFALLLANGVEYHGGALALVGGAATMGAVWGLIAFKTKNYIIVIAAHVITNFFAFSQLLYQNWFV